MIIHLQTFCVIDLHYLILKRGVNCNRKGHFKYLQEPIPKSGILHREGIRVENTVLRGSTKEIDTLLENPSLDRKPFEQKGLLYREISF